MRNILKPQYGKRSSYLGVDVELNTDEADKYFRV